jgi:hypothetical protein
MKIQPNNQPMSQPERMMPQFPKWYAHKGFISILILALLAAGVSRGYFARQSSENKLFQSAAAPTTQLIITEKTGAYVVPVDSTVKRLSFLIVFKPANSSNVADLLNRTGGQSFYFQPSELNKSTDIEAATEGEPVLIVSGKFDPNESRSVLVTTPSGKTVNADANTEVITWSAGQAVIIKNPEPGNWKLNVTGNGEFSLQAMVDSEIAITDWDFVKLGGWPGHEGYFPIDEVPAIGAKQILRVNLSEESDKSEAPSFQISGANGKLIDAPTFYPMKRGEFGAFAGVITIPKQDFRIVAAGRDSRGFKYQRTHSATVYPEHKAAPLTEQEIDAFIKAGEQAKSTSENIANAKIWDIHDEPLFTSNGNLIGIKLRYKIRFPKDMEYRGPQAPDAEFGTYGVYLIARKTGISPPLNAAGYKGGVEYVFNIEYLPFFVRNDGPLKSFCIWRVDAVNAVAQNTAKAKFKIAIPEVNYTGFTEGEYNPQVFYQSAVKEGAKDCVYYQK